MQNHNLAWESQINNPSCFYPGKELQDLLSGEEKLCNLRGMSTRAEKCLCAARTGQQGKPGQAAACSHRYSLHHKLISSALHGFSSFFQLLSSKANEQRQPVHNRSKPEDSQWTSTSWMLAKPSSDHLLSPASRS